MLGYVCAGYRKMYQHAEGVDKDKDFEVAALGCLEW
jgi:hypothetical protein